MFTTIKERSTEQIHNMVTLKFITFHLHGQECAIDFHKVQEVRALQQLDQIANGDAMVNGVAISRGTIMPMVEMRSNRSKPAMQDPLAMVIVLQLSQGVMGLIVDNQTDVVSLTPQQIKPFPNLNTSSDTDYLVGLGVDKDRTLILIDIDKLMEMPQIGMRQMEEPAKLTVGE